MRRQDEDHLGRLRGRPRAGGQQLMRLRGFILIRQLAASCRGWAPGRAQDHRVRLQASRRGALNWRGESAKAWRTAASRPKPWQTGRPQVASSPRAAASPSPRQGRESRQGRRPPVPGDHRHRDLSPGLREPALGYRQPGRGQLSPDPGRPGRSQRRGAPGRGKSGPRCGCGSRR